MVPKLDDDEDAEGTPKYPICKCLNHPKPRFIQKLPTFGGSCGHVRCIYCITKLKEAENMGCNCGHGDFNNLYLIYMV